MFCYGFIAWRFIWNVQPTKVRHDMLTLKVLVATIDAQWEGMGESGGCRVGEVRACTTPPIPDHKGFELQ